MVFYCLCKAFSQDTWGSGPIPPQAYLFSTYYLVLNRDQANIHITKEEQEKERKRDQTNSTAPSLENQALSQWPWNAAIISCHVHCPITNSHTSSSTLPPSTAHSVTDSRAGTLQTINQANREYSPYLQTSTTASGIFTHLVKWSKQVKQVAHVSFRYDLHCFYWDARIFLHFWMIRHFPSNFPLQGYNTIFWSVLHCYISYVSHTLPSDNRCHIAIKKTIQSNPLCQTDSILSENRSFDLCHYILLEADRF